jgi:hypothetical protein
MLSTHRMLDEARGGGYNLLYHGEERASDQDVNLLVRLEELTHVLE